MRSPPKVAAESVLERWRPVTFDFGLMEAAPAAAASTFAQMQREGGIETVPGEVVGSLDDAFAALPPLSMQRRRSLFIATQSGWTAFFRSGIAGSDPFLPMCRLSARLRTRAMRVCVQELPPWPACMWEVYEPEGDTTSGHCATRRVLDLSNDGGRWTFVDHGEPYAFEDRSRYVVRRKRDRFDRALLSRYLEQFALRPFDDAFYRVNADVPALLLEERTAWPGFPEYTLSETRAGVPWQRAGDAGNAAKSQLGLPPKRR